MGHLSIFCWSLGIMGAFVLTSPLYGTVPLKPLRIQVNPGVMETQSATDQKGTDLPCLLEKIPSLWIPQKGVPGPAMVGNFQGLPGHYTGVLLDGNGVKNGATGQTDLSQFTKAGTNRVTHIGGPSVILYSNQAADILKLDSDYQRAGGHVTAQGGSFQTGTATTAYTARQKNAIHTIFANHEETGGVPQYGAYRRYGERNKYLQENGGIVSTYQVDNETQLKATARAHSSRLKYDTGPMPLPAKPQGTQENTIYMVGITGSHRSKNDHHGQQLSVHHTREKNNYDLDSKNRSDLTQASWRHDVNWSWQNRTQVVMEEEILRLKMGPAFNRHRSTPAVAVLHGHRLSDLLRVELGVRQEYPGHIKLPLKGTIGFAWEQKARKIFGSWRQAGRLPTLAEQYQGTPYFRPNPHLRPEKLNLYEGGYEHTWQARHRGQVKYFHHILGHHLQGYAISPLQSSVQNVKGTHHVQGIESLYEYAMDEKGRFRIQYTHTAPRSKGIKTSTPRHRAYGELDWSPVEKWSFMPSVEYRGQRQGFTQQLKPYYLTHFKIAYRIQQENQVFLKIENVWDERYEVMENFQSPRRGIYVGIHFNF